jgi:crotonobetainyl-CoA:carnitine CoA-transferase CaiB-like acyl-CoA transferase
MTAASALPLDGLRVLDFTHAAAGPFTTMLMADMGAEVIKVERREHGDGSRSMGRPMPDFPRRNSDYYLSLNRNKRGIVLDLSSERGAQIARDLAGVSDVVIQNFRPGVMDRLGLGYEDLRGLRSELVYCSISAFGDEGPWAKRPANDIIMQSVSGLMGVTGERGGGPVRIGAPVSDFATGLFALAGVLAALHVRAEHPDGQHVRISMLEASLNLMCNYIPSVAALGERVPRLGRAHAQIVPYQAFACADGEYVMVGAFTRNFWQRLARAVGHEEWITDPRFATNSARLDHREELVGALEEIFASADREHWLAVLEEADVPASPVLELDEVVVSEPVVAAGSIRTTSGDGREAQVVRSPLTVAEWGEPPARIAPGIGRDTEEVLRELLGLSDDVLAELSAAGAGA